jgi:Transcription elongation factor, N-terminal
MAVKRPRLIQRMQEAIADDSNLAENSEYHAAQADKLINEARIGELEDKLAHAKVIDVSKLSGDTIKFGAKCTFTDFPRQRILGSSAQYQKQGRGSPAGDTPVAVTNRNHGSAGRVFDYIGR